MVVITRDRALGDTLTDVEIRQTRRPEVLMRNIKDCLSSVDLYEINETEARLVKDKILPLAHELSPQILLKDHSCNSGSHLDLSWQATEATQMPYFLSILKDTIAGCLSDEKQKSSIESAYLIYKLLQTYPDGKYKEAIQQLTENGQLDIGATLSLIDWRMAGVLLSDLNIELPEELGIPVGNTIQEKDVFGDPANLPKFPIIKGLVLMNSRGLPEEFAKYPLLYFKSGESKILYFNQQAFGGYGNFCYPGRSDVSTYPEDPCREQKIPRNNTAKGLRVLQQYIDWYEKYGKNLENVGCTLGALFCGVDYSYYQDDLPYLSELLKEYLPEQNFKVSTFSETIGELFRHHIENNLPIPVVEGDCFHIEEAGSIRAEEDIRIHLRQWKDDLLDDLINTQYVSALAANLGYEYPKEELLPHIIRLIISHAHDAEGCHIDEVTKEMIAKLENETYPGLRYLFRRALVEAAAGKIVRVNEREWAFPSYGVINPFDNEFDGLVKLNLAESVRKKLLQGENLEIHDSEGNYYIVNSVDPGKDRSVRVHLTIPAGGTKNIFFTTVPPDKEKYLPYSEKEIREDAHILDNGKMRIECVNDGSLLIRKNGQEIKMFFRDIGDAGDTYTGDPLSDNIWESINDKDAHISVKKVTGELYDEMEVTIDTRLPSYTETGIKESGYGASRSEIRKQFRIVTTIRLAKEADNVDFKIEVDNRQIQDHFIQLVAETDDGNSVRSLDFGKMASHQDIRDELSELALQRFDDGIIAIGETTCLYSKGTGKSFTIHRKDGKIEAAKTLFRSTGILSRLPGQIKIRPTGASADTPTPAAQGNEILKFDIRLDFHGRSIGDNDLYRRYQKFRQELIIGPVIETGRRQKISDFGNQFKSEKDEPVLINVDRHNGKTRAKRLDVYQGRLIKEDIV